MSNEKNLLIEVRLPWWAKEWATPLVTTGIWLAAIGIYSYRSGDLIEFAGMLGTLALLLVLFSALAIGTPLFYRFMAFLKELKEDERKEDALHNACRVSFVEFQTNSEFTGYRNGSKVKGTMTSVRGSTHRVELLDV